jgi:hypothetical protein
VGVELVGLLHGRGAHSSDVVVKDGSLLQDCRTLVVVAHAGRTIVVVAGSVQSMSEN